METLVGRRRRVSLFAVSLTLATLLLFLSAPMKATAAPAAPQPSGWPLAGAISVVKGFDPPGTPWGAGHRGVDLVERVGERVLATADGTVTFAGQLAGRGVVVITHGDLRTTYEPVDALLPVGVRVRQGEVIGVVSRGSHCATSACLHWGLRAGDAYLNPLGAATGATEAPTGTGVRLVSAAERAVAQRRAAERAAAARAADAALGGAGFLIGARGRHGFLHPVAGGITSGFGKRLHPVLKIWKLHDGTDFGAACGTPIRAPFAGRVTRAYFNAGYGNRLMLDHGTVAGHRVTTGFNHATSYAVGVGAQVSRGQVIGYVGSTGYATGCHLHLMVWIDGGVVNPMSWF